MNRVWKRETLRHVDAWACREGCPEDDEDQKRAELAPGELPADAAQDPEKDLARDR